MGHSPGGVEHSCSGRGGVLSVEGMSVSLSGALGRRGARDARARQPISAPSKERAAARPRPAHQHLHPQRFKDTEGEGCVDSGDT